ncbi:MAG: VirB4 family type IV secretion system protein, partial [Actinomycetota bacterium]
EGAGITADPRTHARPAPLLSQLAEALAEAPEGASLARRLTPYTTGSHRGLFDRPTTVRPEGHLVVMSLRDLPEELKAAGTLLALEAVWRRVVRGERRHRIVVVDEAWWLLRSGSRHAAMFLHRLAKSARKHWCGLTTITQDVGDVLSSELGQAVITNASTHVLLGQSPQAIEALSRVFHLSKGEGSYLLSCQRGQGLLSLGSERAALQVIASEDEHALVTTDPAELAAMEEA